MRGWRGRGGQGGFGIPEFGNEWRARRGDIKFLLLETLAEGPMHGYEVIRRLSERHEGRYRPSPGSVYPTLQMLEEGGFLSGELIDGKRVYTITESGRSLLEERTAPDEDADESAAGTDRRRLRKSSFSFVMAMRQGLHHTDPVTRERVRAVIDRARREIYAILAEDE
jgi:DNA-binding PadR family transcriptional regulator